MHPVLRTVLQRLGLGLLTLLVVSVVIFSSLELLPGGYAQVYARFRDKAGNDSIVYHDDVIVKKPGLLGSILGRLTLRLLPAQARQAAHDGDAHESAGLAGAMISTPDHPDVPPAFADESGVFVLDDLPPGAYTIEIRQHGFKTLRFDNVTVGEGGIVDLGNLDLRQQAQIKTFLPLIQRN